MYSYGQSNRAEGRLPQTIEGTGTPCNLAAAQDTAVAVVLLDPTIDGPLSIRDVCTYTGLSRTKISGEIQAGSLPARKAGRRTLVMRSDLTRWLLSLPEIRPTAPRGEQS